MGPWTSTLLFVSESTGEAPGFLEDIFEVEVWGQTAGMTAATTTVSTALALEVPAPHSSGWPLLLFQPRHSTLPPTRNWRRFRGEIRHLQEWRWELQLQDTLGHLQWITWAEEELAATRRWVQQLEEKLGQVLSSATAVTSNTVATLITRELILYPCQPPAWPASRGHNVCIGTWWHGPVAAQSAGPAPELWGHLTLSPYIRTWSFFILSNFITFTIIMFNWGAIFSFSLSFSFQRLKGS